MMTTEKQVPTVEQIREKLGSDPRWVERGILAIFKFQTADEQQAEVTNKDNGVGFNGADANILSSFAKQILRSIERYGKRYEGRRLTEGQVPYAYKKMPKYARQLHRIATGKVTLP